MRDDLKGGLLATVVAAPVVMVCCGSGGLVLAALTGALGGWLGSGGGILTVLLASIGALTVRSIRRARASLSGP